MNFYISETIEKTDVTNENIYIDDELQQYLYNNRDNVKFDMKNFLEINPYGDTLLYSNEIRKLLEICNMIIESNILVNYDDSQNAKNTFLELKSFLEKALDINNNVVVMGD